jgi:hypothetical protein
MNTKTAQITTINRAGLVDPDDWTTGTAFDTIEIRQDGELIDTLTVEASEDTEPYDEALRAAGHGDARWIN